MENDALVLQAGDRHLMIDTHTGLPEYLSSAQFLLHMQWVWFPELQRSLPWRIDMTWQGKDGQGALKLHLPTWQTPERPLPAAIFTPPRDAIRLPEGAE